MLTKLTIPALIPPIYHSNPGFTDDKKIICKARKQSLNFMLTTF